MKTMTKVLIGLSVLAGLVVLANVFLLIYYKTTTKLIYIPPIKI